VFSFLSSGRSASFDGYKIPGRSRRLGLRVSILSISLMKLMSGGLIWYD